MRTAGNQSKIDKLKARAKSWRFAAVYRRKKIKQLETALTTERKLSRTLSRMLLSKMGFSDTKNPVALASLRNSILYPPH